MSKGAGNMKRIIAAVLALMLSMSLFACSDGGDMEASQASQSVVGGNGENSEDIGMGETIADGTAGVQVVNKSAEEFYGFYDNSYDYSAEEQYSVAYIVQTSGVLYEAFSHAFSLWAGRYNCDYSFYDCAGSVDRFLAEMQSLASEGVTGFLLDPDSQFYPRVTELAQELVGDAWMGCMSYPYGKDGLMNHPYVGFDQYDFGVRQAEYVISYAKENFEGFDIKEAAMINIDWSADTLLHERGTGARDTFLKYYPGKEEQFFNLDTAASGGMTESAAYELVDATVKRYSEIKYWLICGTIDQFALGALDAIEENGLEDTSVITCCGGTALINLWDSGEDTCFKSALYTAQPIYAEPIFGAMYYMMRGWCSAENIWSDYENSRSNGYGWLILSSFCIEKDTYQDYLEWVDWHSGFNWSEYGEWSGTEYEIVLPPLD